MLSEALLCCYVEQLYEPGYVVDTLYLYTLLVMGRNTVVVWLLLVETIDWILSG